MARILHIELSEAQAQRLAQELPYVTHLLYTWTWICLGVRHGQEEPLARPPLDCAVPNGGVCNIDSASGPSSA
eukprot:scaffold518_cov388-Prasinococcus_capsulatus_cf.AAC.16